MHQTRAADASAAGPKVILWAGLVAGLLDITAAFVVYGFFGAAPLRILQGIAGGLLGPRTSSASSSLRFPQPPPTTWSAAASHFSSSRPPYPAYCTALPCISS
jgi:hypothetical protein